MLLTGCHWTQDPKDMIVKLSEKEKELNCQLASMKNSITREWDNINNLLEASLPEEMPEDERNNILAVRNANLIRMFQSFENIDDSIKMALKITEQKDMEMSKRLQALKQEASAIQKEKIKIFQTVNQTGGEQKLIELKTLNQKILSKECKNIIPQLIT